MDEFKNILKKYIILITIVFITLSFNSMNANATNKNNVTKEKGQKEYNLKNEIVFKGVFSSHSSYFDVSKWWSINSIDLDFKFTINQILDKNAKAYLTFSLNGIPFKSQEVKYKKDTSSQIIKMKIPKKLIKVGGNELKVESYSRISDLPCVDDVNNANWLTVEKGTSINIKFNKIKADDMISNFPYPFIQTGNKKSEDAQIIIPQNYSNEELSNALILSNYLGGKNGDNYDGTLVKYNNMDKNKDMIFIGLYENLPYYIQKYIGKDINDDNAVINIMESPYSKKDYKKLLIITSKNKNMLKKAIKLMMNSNIVSQLHINKYIVTKDVDELIKIKENGDKIYFENLVGNKILLRGMFRRSANFAYKLPKNKILANGGNVELNFRYSENLDFDRSLLTIYINGIPIGSKKLKLENANGDSVLFNIPNDIEETSYLNIEIAFDLQMKNVWCEKRQEETPWAYVMGNSSFYIPTKNNMEYYFSDYPNPFVKNKNLNDILLVLPENLSSTELTTLNKMFAYIGRDVEYNKGELYIEKGNNVTNLKDKSNIIVYGTPSNNQFIKDINDNLWFKYKNEFKQFDSNEKEFLTEPYNEEIATFQFDVSPFNSQKAILVLTSPDEKILNKSMKYLTSDDIYKLTGDSAIIDKYGDIRNYKMKKYSNEKPIYEKIKKTSALTKGLFGLLVLIFILIILSIVLYLSKYKKEENNENDKNEINKILKK